MSFTLDPVTPPSPLESLPPPGTQFQFEGEDLGGQTPARVDFVGDGVAATYDPATGVVTVEVAELPPPPPAPGLQIQLDDIDVGAKDTVTLNFEGTGVSVVDDGAGRRTALVSTSGSGGGGDLTVMADEEEVVSNVALLNLADSDGDIAVYPGSGGKVNVDFRSSALTLIQTGWTGANPNSWAYPGFYDWTNWKAVTAVEFTSVDPFDWGTLPVADMPQWDPVNLWFTAPEALIGRPILVCVSMLGAVSGSFPTANLLSMRAVDRLQSGGLNDATHRPVCMKNMTNWGINITLWNLSMTGLWIPEAGRALQLQFMNNSGYTATVNDIYTTLKPLVLGEGREGSL